MATTDTSATTPNVREYFLEDASTFDPARVIIRDPVTSSFTVGTATIENTTSEGCYLDDEGNECVLLFSGLTQNCQFGVSYQYAMDVPKAEQIPENAKGFQICYQLTSLSTVAKPTPAEQAQIDFLQGLWDALVAKGQEETEREELLVPPNVQAAFTMAAKKKNWAYAVKPAFEYPKTKDGKSIDKTKPLRMYVKLVKSGEGPTLKALTPFYGPGDKKYNAVRYVGVRGNITPVFRWSGVFWGAHGPRSSYGASLRFELVEANYNPVASTSLPSRRLLGANTAPPQEDDDEYDVPPRKSRAARAADPEEDDGEDEFAEPGSDAAKPVAALSKAANKKPSSSLAKPATKAGAKPPTATPKGPGKASAAVKPAPKAGAAKPVSAAAKAAATPAVKTGTAKAGAAKPAAPVKGAKPTAAKAKAAPKKPTPPPEDDPDEGGDDGDEVGDDVDVGSDE